MPQLIVENLGPIRYAALEFRDVNVLIGEQASGKSTLAALAYFCGHLLFEETPEFNAWTGSASKYWAEEIAAPGFSRYFAHLIGENRFKLSYHWDETQYIVFEGGKSQKVSAEVKPESRQLQSFIDSISRDYQYIFSPASRNVLYANTDSIATKVFNLERERQKLRAKGLPESLNLLLIEKFYKSTLGNADLLNSFLGTGSSYEKVRNHFKRGGVDGFSSVHHEGLNALEKLSQSIQKGIYHRTQEGETLRVSDNGTSIPLTHASSGQQESVQLMVEALCSLVRREKICWIIEEPEAHLFPAAQYAVLKAVSVLMNALSNQSKVLLTTHSPYILAGLNNLLLAGTLGEKLGANLQTDIPALAHLRPNQVGAYALENGELKSLLNKDTGLIEAESFDGVSIQIAAEFEQLLRQRRKTVPHG